MKVETVSGRRAASRSSRAPAVPEPLARKSSQPSTIGSSTAAPFIVTTWRRWGSWLRTEAIFCHWASFSTRRTGASEWFRM